MTVFRKPQYLHAFIDLNHLSGSARRRGRPVCTPFGYRREAFRQLVAEGAVPSDGVLLTHAETAIVCARISQRSCDIQNGEPPQTDASANAAERASQLRRHAEERAALAERQCGEIADLIIRQRADGGVFE